MGPLEFHKAILDVKLDTKLGQDFDVEQTAENFAMEQDCNMVAVD